MSRIRFITVHHTGSRVIYDTDQAAVARRLEQVRRIHVDSNGWGDIGYHFIVDRAGRIWEGRPLTLQGAHVRDRNEGNIGVVCLGNFEDQKPSTGQVQAMQVLLRDLRTKYAVSLSGVRTHREWAPTKCPGRHLQAHIDRRRDSRLFA